MSEDIVWGIILIIIGNFFFWFRDKFLKVFPIDKDDPLEYTYEQRISKMLLGSIAFVLIGLFLIIRAIV